MSINTLSCTQCGAAIQEPKARHNSGLCGPCFKGAYTCVDCGRKVMSMDGVDQSDQRCISCVGKHGRARNQEALATEQTQRVHYVIEGDSDATGQLIEAAGMILSVTNAGRVVGRIGKTVEFEVIDQEMMDKCIKMALNVDTVVQYDLIISRVEENEMVRLNTSKRI